MIYWLQKTSAAATDRVLCSMMNSMQWKLRNLACSAAELEAYLRHCASIERSEFFAAPPCEMRLSGGHRAAWTSPHRSGFAANDSALAEIFRCDRGPAAPTVLLLHGLMSTRPDGYYALARQFNRNGWNAVFPHLPFHYSRNPPGYRNGALAITANLVRNGETLRQAVKEIRQLMGWLRAQGTREFGLIGTSYGGWVGALTSFIEEDWRFVALLQPIANVKQAIWRNPAATAMRKILEMQGIEESASDRHRHLTSPMHGRPLADPTRILLCAAEFDAVSPPSELERLAVAWQGCRVVHVRQGHFGYRALARTMRELEPWIRGNA